MRSSFLCSSFIRSVGDELVFLKRTYKMVSVDRLTTSTHPKHVEQLVKLAGIKTSGAMRKLPGHPQMDDVDNTPELEAHEASEFRSGVGILLYLAPDLPNAQHAITHSSSGMSRPTQRIKDFLRQFLSYLCGSKGLCLSLQFAGGISGWHHVMVDATQPLGWDVMTFAALAHMVDATQHLGWGEVGCVNVRCI